MSDGHGAPDKSVAITAMVLGAAVACVVAWVHVRTAAHPAAVHPAAPPFTCSCTCTHQATPVPEPK